MVRNFAGLQSNFKEPETNWYEPIAEFGANVQRGATFVLGTVSPIYNIVTLGQGFGVTFGEIVPRTQNAAIKVQEGFATYISEPIMGAGKTLTEFSENLQKFSYNLQVGASEFAKTGGQFLNRLSGGEGLFPQLGAALPFIAIGLIALAVILRK